MCEIPKVYTAYEKRVQRIIISESTQYVPWHIDPLLEKFILDTDGHLYLIDWDYSANYLPEWDIAWYILEVSLAKNEEKILIETYQNSNLTFEKVALQK